MNEIYGGRRVGSGLNAQRFGKINKSGHGLRGCVGEIMRGEKKATNFTKG